MILVFCLPGNYIRTRPNSYYLTIVVTYRYDGGSTAGKRLEDL